MPAPAGWERGERARLSAIALFVLALHGVVAVSFYHRGLGAEEVVGQAIDAWIHVPVIFKAA